MNKLVVSSYAVLSRCTGLLVADVKEQSLDIDLVIPFALTH